MEAATRTSLPSMRYGCGEGDAQPVGDVLDARLALGVRLPAAVAAG